MTVRSINVTLIHGQNNNNSQGYVEINRKVFTARTKNTTNRTI